MAATFVVPDLMEKYAAFSNPSEAAYIAVCLEVLPKGLLGLTIAGLFAATMSSMDTALNVNAGFLVKNFYQPIFRKNASEKEQLTAGHIATIFCGVVILGLAILLVTRGNISLFDAYLYINAYIQAPLTVAAVNASAGVRRSRTQARVSTNCMDSVMEEPGLKSVERAMGRPSSTIFLAGASDGRSR